MLRKMNIVLAIAAMMILSSFVLAQKDQEIEKQVESKMSITDAQRKEAEKGVKRESLEMSERLAVKCPLGVHSTIMGGINDNLALPFEPVYKSPALISALNNIPTKDFDDTKLNKAFAYSFVLKKYKPCEGRACKGQLLIRVCNINQDLWSNDKLYVGSADPGHSLTEFFYGNIWNGNEGGKCKDLIIPLNPISLLTTMNNLDVVIQDDTAVDYMQLDLYF